MEMDRQRKCAPKETHPKKAPAAIGEGKGFVLREKRRFLWGKGAKRGPSGGIEKRRGAVMAPGKKKVADKRRQGGNPNCLQRGERLGGTCGKRGWC